MLDSETLKTCPKCNVSREYSEFYRNKTRIDGLDTYCKYCKSAYEKKNRTPAKNKAKHLKRCYGLSLDEFSKMYHAQHGRCRICMEPIQGKNANVDHCHSTGKIRGLLCSSCNKGLGNFKDSPLLLQSAINYLENN